MNERSQFFIKIYLSHFILERVAKRLILVMCEKWVGDGTDCNILTPSSSDYSSTIFSFCCAAQPGSWGPKPSVWSWFSLPRTATPTPTNSFSKSLKSQPIASGHDIIHTPVLFPIRGFYYDICDCHILCARAWTVLNVCAPALRAE